MDTLRRLNDRALGYADAAVARYRALSRAGQMTVCGMLALNLFFFVAFWTIGPERVAEQFAQWADDLAASPYGWAILFAVIIVTSVPPLLGYGTAQTLVGFAYGVWPGFLLSAVSCLAGGAFAFLIVRRFVRYFAPFLQHDRTHQALSRAVRAKGLPLMMLLRLAPFPYPYSNAFFASIETVTLGQFLLATLAITPKLLLHVIIGHRTYLFADPASRRAMDPLSRWLNGVFLVVGTIVGAGTSWYLYRLTMRYVEEAAREAEAVEGAVELGQDDDEEEGEERPTTGLLREVDGFLDEEEEEEDKRDRGGAAAAGRNGGGTRGKLSQQDGWGGFDLDEEEEEEEISVGPREGRRTSPPPLGTTSRRDSTAWGLELDLDDEERGEPRPGRLRLD